MMKTVCAFLVLIPAVFAVDCTTLPNGVYEKGCRAFVTCTNKVAHVTECPGNYVFNEKTGKCADPNSFKTLCAQSKDCSTLADGHYADLMQKCRTYYTCTGGTYFGHNYCPGTTVFNKDVQACDWIFDTDPPCGTRGLSTPSSG